MTIRREGPHRRPPGAELAVEPQPGAPVLFKWRGAWVLGAIVGEGNKLRLPVRRENAFGKSARAIYWRSRTQLYRPPAAP